MPEMQILKDIAKQCRKDVLRMVMKVGEGHIASSFSCLDILSTLYFSVINVDPSQPDWEERDRFILSKGHGADAIYTILARKGFFPVKYLDTVDQEGTAFGGHPDMKMVPGLDLSTGSLGHGLSVGAGMSLSSKKDKKQFRVFVLMGDGECQEGSVWEAGMFSACQGLDNLIGIVDYNRQQAIGMTGDILPLNPFAEKWKAFGWAVKEVDGHNFEELLNAFNSLPFEKGKPSMIIARTVKGKGVSFMEKQIHWHARATTQAEYEKALSEIDQQA